MSGTRFVAIDIGAESGRAIEGRLDGDKLHIREMHRFQNTPVRIGNSLRWNLDALMSSVREAIARCEGPDLASIGIDTWAIDFVLLDADDRVIEPPYHYRDNRTDGMMEEAFRAIGRKRIYDETGIQFLQINTLYQLLAMVRSGSPALHAAKTFLTIPDYLNFALTGVKGCEFTNATTTQCFNPRQRDWAWDMLESLGIPTGMFPKIVSPGTALGRVRGESTTLVAPACHDTGSAVAAVPNAATERRSAWISSGTWSIMGVETPVPIISEASCNANFTNEGGIEGTFRFCKNVMGLWILQQCRAQWESEGRHLSYAEIVDLADSVESGDWIFDPDDPEMLKPGDMTTRIRSKVASRGGKVPVSPGEVARAVLESLAAKYKIVLGQLANLTGQSFAQVNIVGGGSQNKLLDGLTARHCGVPVYAGPAEATAIGNLLMQMKAMGEIGSIEEGRSLVAASFEPDRFDPQSKSAK